MSSLVTVGSLPIIALLTTSPWATLDRIWTSITGYAPDAFEFVPGKTRLATGTESLAAIALYYVVIFGGREFMKNRPAFKLNTLFMIHNFVLSVGSGALLVLYLEQIVPTLWRNGLFHCICGAGGWTNKLVTLYYLNYMTKYIELLDTVFLVLKKKPLTFLHCYHHGATALLCYTQLAGSTSLSWVPIVLNLAIHVVMYWYYFQSARGKTIWWKQYITQMQIIQFVIGLGFIYFGLWQRYASRHNPSLPHIGQCDGNIYAGYTGAGIISSYLLLFIFFYIATYKRAMKSRKSVVNMAVKIEKSSRDIREAADEMKRMVQGGLRIQD